MSGVIDIQTTAGVIDIQKTSGVAILTLPAKFDTTQTVEVENATLSIDLYGRVESITPSSDGNPIKNIYSTVFSGNRDTSTYNFETTAGGKFRGVYKGYLETTATGVGLVSAPGTIQVTVDGQSIQTYVILNNNNQIVGLEFVTTLAYSPGAHSVVIEYGRTISSVGIFDLFVCL
jgi:hypothetical protein